MYHITVTTTTPAVALLSPAVSTTMTVKMAPTFINIAAVLGHDVGLSPKLTPRATMRGAVGLAIVQQQQQLQSQMSSQGSANYAKGHP